jgi:hypothetical protein
MPRLRSNFLAGHAWRENQSRVVQPRALIGNLPRESPSDFFSSEQTDLAVLTDVDCTEGARLAPKRFVRGGRDQYHSPQLACSDFHDFDPANICFCGCTPMHFARYEGLVFTYRHAALLY